jgi:hypothetical protein
VAPDGTRLQKTITLNPDYADSLRDGMPDFARLDEGDADAFRRWFTFLAESQHFTESRRSGVRDCAALLRFAFRESLRTHDGRWAAALNLIRVPDAPNVAKYSYPYTPFGAALFRTRTGTFIPSDLHDGAFSEFADAESLRRFNTFFVSRSIERARSGDLLFFRQFDQRSPFHAMVYLERSRIDETAEPLVVYHTGPIGDRVGEVRRPTIRELMRYPDPRWRPVVENPSFLGVYRWNILHGAN